jgi:hypothetical protein
LYDRPGWCLFPFFGAVGGLRIKIASRLPSVLALDGVILATDCIICNIEHYFLQKVKLPALKGGASGEFNFKVHHTHTRWHRKNLLSLCPSYFT